MISYTHSSTTYCCVHYSSPMGADGVGNMANIDGGKKLGFGGALHEYLVVKVIAVVGDKDVNVPHDLKNIQTLSHTWHGGQHN